MNRKLSALVILAAACSTLSSFARAHGAIAVADDPKGSGWAIEIRINHPSAEDARSFALKRCRERAVDSKLDPDLCKVVSEFRNRCGAGYMKPRGTGEGWAVEDTIEEARMNARESCWKATHDGNKADCAELYAGCDVTK